MNSKIKAILKRIKIYDSIVIARHIGPDPDAIASQIALRDSIKLKFPTKKVYAVGTSVAKFKSYGELDKVDEKIFSRSLLFVLDCPNIARIDGVDIEKFKEVIKIDHHPFIDRMGIIEWVDTKYTSTCEMICEFLITTRFRSNKKIAENLFLGVVSDSDRFLFNTTTPRTLELMAILIKNSKIDITKLYPRLYERPLNELRFQSFITEHLHVTKNGFASLKIDKSVLEKYRVDASTPSNLVNNFNNIKEIFCWALVTYDEKLKLYKVNIRSRGPEINKIAEKFNGGGHKLAAGARIENPLDVDKLIRELDKECKKYKEDNKIDDFNELLNTKEMGIVKPKQEEKKIEEKTDNKQVKEKKKDETQKKEPEKKNKSQKKEEQKNKKKKHAKRKNK